MIEVYGKGNYKNKLVNTYEIVSDYAILTIARGDKFKVDIDLIYILKKHTWVAHSDGCCHARIDGKMVLLNRFVTNASKGIIVDHINQDRGDNRRCNLRFVTRQINGYNTPITSNNKSGVRGVTFDKQTGKWIAQICYNGKNKKLGRFNTIDEAKDVYLRAKMEYMQQT